MSDIETRGGTIENHYEGRKGDYRCHYGASALSPELRAALTKAVEEVFS